MFRIINRTTHALVTAVLLCGPFTFRSLQKFRACARARIQKRWTVKVNGFASKIKVERLPSNNLNPFKLQNANDPSRYEHTLS